MVQVIVGGIDAHSKLVIASDLRKIVRCRERPVVAGNGFPRGITTEAGEIANVRKPRKTTVTNIAFRRVGIRNAEHALPEGFSIAWRSCVLAHSCKPDMSGKDQAG